MTLQPGDRTPELVELVDQGRVRLPLSAAAEPACDGVADRPAEDVHPAPDDDPGDHDTGDHPEDRHDGVRPHRPASARRPAAAPPRGRAPACAR